MSCALGGHHPRIIRDARICARGITVLCVCLPPALGHLGFEAPAVKNPPLACAAFGKCQPLFHKHGIYGFSVIDRRVICHGALGLHHIKLAGLGVAHLFIVNVGERDQGRPADTAHDHHLADFADDVVRINIFQALALARENFYFGKIKELT